MSKKTSGSQMSLPTMARTKKVTPEGYYSGDKPNPNLFGFGEQHIKERPHDPATDKYDVSAFDKPIETTKATSIYNMHTYWSKKPHEAIREYIRHYTRPGDLVLDPFCGSGGTALAALMDGRKAVAIDRSPAATFITKNYCTPVDPDALREAFEHVQALTKDELDWLYETKCDRCGGKAMTAYTVYSQVFQCPRCMEKMPLFDCVEVDGETAAGKPKKVNVCPHCHKKGNDEVIRSQSEKFGIVPVSVSYLCENGCKPKRGSRLHDDANKSKREYFAKYDAKKLKDIESKPIPHWFPQGFDMTGFSRYQRDALFYYGVKEVSDLFTKRNLWALAALLAAIKSVAPGDVRDALLFSLTSIMLKSSKMMAHNNDGIGRIQKGTYYLPQIEHDVHVGEFLEEAVGDMIRGYEVIYGISSPMISTASAIQLGLPASSVDYIFTDPPYAEKVQYGELNFVWEAWLGLDTKWHNEEIIVNEVRGTTEADWTRMMKLAVAECYRVLKPGRSISVCYHDTSEGTWALLQDIMAEAGFVTENTGEALYIESATKTTNQYFADKVNKRDLVINFRKPKPGEFRVTRLLIPENADIQTFRELARQIIRDYLMANPASTKDRIYDELVSRMVRAGQMQAHNFEELLREVADEVKEARKKDLFQNQDPDLYGTHEIARWYLKETEETVLDAAETAIEDKCASVLEKFIVKKTDESGEEGVHYSDLFEHFLYALKEKPRRPLSDILTDYLFKTENGTWRAPSSDEERELKERSRATGESRRIKRFANILSTGVSIPQSKTPSSGTLAEWIRHAKRSGLFEAGKLLFERGGLDMDKLSEEMQVEVEEDYQTCVRALQRAAGGEVAPKKRERKKK